MQEKKLLLEHKAYNMRVSSLKMTTKAGSGHPTSALSCADIVSALFFYGMQYDPKNPQNPNNDRFILSKGHASPILYAAYKELGVLTEQELLTYRAIDSVLEGHPTMRFAYSEAATGSLGMGLSVGLGMALAARLSKASYFTYVVLGDSEIAEGSVWEAAELASYYQADNLVAIVDCNRLGQTGQVLHDHHVQRYADKFHAFGWNTLIIDGHDMQEIMGALDKARKPYGDKPTVIIAKTFKGHGIAIAEDKNGFHGKAFSKDELPEILAKMAARFPAAADYTPTKAWQPHLPEHKAEQPDVGTAVEMPISHYEVGEKLATRRAYGQALRRLGAENQAIIALDAEVKNSTYAELFEEKYPHRFFQCFIAEQNMVSMAVGMEKRGYVPFVSTFGAFFSRAHDQIRMAAIGQAKLRLVGSHVGVSIGQDGPSQMALEDIGMMTALPGSVVLYPSDAVSAHQLVGQMVNYTKGISYLRTTRGETPVLYDVAEEFPIGGCKVLRQSANDVCCVIGAGVTLHEALKAYDMLKEKGIFITVIDLYSIKPLDQKTIISCAQKAGNRILTVEDHYLEGGIGQAVTFGVKNTGIMVDCLAVTQLPRSGKPEELLAMMGIDAQAIVQCIMR